MSPFFLALPERGDDGKSIFVREVPSKFTSSNIEVNSSRNSSHFLSNLLFMSSKSNNPSSLSKTTVCLVFWVLEALKQRL